MKYCLYALKQVAIREAAEATSVSNRGFAET